MNIAVKKIIAAAVFAYTVILNTVLFIILPSEIVLQVTYNGDTAQKFPKLFGLLFVAALSIYLDYKFYKSDKQSGEVKWLVFTLFFVAINIVILFLNR